MRGELNLKKIDEMIIEDIRMLPKDIFSLKRKILYFSKSVSTDTRFEFLEKINQQLGKNIGIITVLPGGGIERLKDRDLIFVSEPKVFSPNFFKEIDLDICNDLKDWWTLNDYSSECSNLQLYGKLNNNTAIVLTCYAVRYIEKMLERIQPDAVILWNQFYSINQIVEKICKKAGIQLIYMEFGVLPGTFALESMGQMGESYPAINAKEFSKTYVDSKMLENAEKLRNYFFESGLNRKVQPATGQLEWIKERIIEGSPVLLYTGQNDFDSGIYPYTERTQKYHSPVYTSSDEAAYHLAVIAKENGWNLIYKPHPLMVKHQKNKKDFPDNVIYVEQANINEIIDYADVVVTILSQTAYVASIREKPVLMLGYNQICKIGCVYETYEKKNVEQTLKDVLKFGYTQKMHDNFIKHIAQLVKCYLYDDLTEKPFSCGKNISQAVRFIEGCIGNRLNSDWVDWKKTDGIVVWGAGGQAQVFMEKYFEDPQIDAFVDNDVNKHGEFYWGREIFSPELLAKKKKKIIICSLKWEEIGEQLEEMGYRAFEDYIPDWILDVKKEVMYDNVELPEEKIAFIKLRKKLIAFMGNCQTNRLIESLKRSDDFNRNYLLIRLPLINNITQWQGILGLQGQVIKEIDVFVTQYITRENRYSPLWSTEHFKTLLSPTCEVIVIPNLFFIGYYPQYGHISKYKKIINEKKNKEFGANDIFPWGDMFIEQLYENGNSVDEIITILKNPDFLTKEYVEMTAENSLTELETREKVCDIKISDYIRENYRESLLFYSRNHPVRKVIDELANRLLKYMGYFSKVSTPLFVEGYDNNQMVIYPTVKKHLGLLFKKDYIYCTKPYYEEALFLDEFIKEYIKKLLLKLEER